MIYLDRKLLQCILSYVLEDNIRNFKEIFQNTLCLLKGTWGGKVVGQYGGMKSDDQQESSSHRNNKIHALWVSMATEHPS